MASKQRGLEREAVQQWFEQCCSSDVPNLSLRVEPGPSAATESGAALHCPLLCSCCSSLQGSCCCSTTLYANKSCTPFHLLPLHSKYILGKTWQHVWCAHEFLLPQIPSRSDNTEILCLFGNSVSLHLLWHSIFQLKYLRVSKNMCMF